MTEMELLFNTCNALRDKLFGDLIGKINPANDLPVLDFESDRATPTAYYNGVVLQTPGVNSNVCFSDKLESKNCMVEFVRVVSDEFKTTVLEEYDFDGDSNECDVSWMCETYKAEVNIIPATRSSIHDFLIHLMVNNRTDFISGPLSAELFILKLTHVLLDIINNDSDDEWYLKYATGSGLSPSWRFSLAKIIQKTLLLPRFTNVVLSIDDVLLDVDEQGGKVDLLDYKRFQQTHIHNHMTNECTSYQHIVSTGNAAFLEWKMFERECQGILQQTSIFAKFASGVQQALEGALCNILDVHGAWPKRLACERAPYPPPPSPKRARTSL
jgi:hypothetical protein